MKTTFRNVFSAKGLFIAGTFFALLAGSNRILKGFNPQPDPPGIWGMMGVTPVDTIRINVVNMEFAGIPPGPCNVALKFLNGQGQVLKFQTFAIKPAQAAFLDLSGVEAGAGFRTPVHPVLVMSNTNPVGCSAVGSVEIFNSASGETSVFAHPVFLPPPSAVRAGG